jgi:hypothetical protein
MTDQITLDQVRNLAAEIVAENPNLTNPRGESGSCLYRRIDGSGNANEPNVAERCLGGEILHRLGLAMPPEFKVVYFTLDVNRFTVEAMDYLSVLQGSADTTTMHGDPTWGEALQKANERFAYRQ